MEFFTSLLGGAGGLTGGDPGGATSSATSGGGGGVTFGDFVANGRSRLSRADFDVLPIALAAIVGGVLVYAIVKK